MVVARFIARLASVWLRTVKLIVGRRVRAPRPTGAQHDFWSCPDWFGEACHASSTR